MIKRNTILLLAILLTSMCITACGNTDSKENDYKDDYILELSQFISGDTADNLSIVADDVVLSNSDVIKALGTKVIKSYKSDSAYYMQIDNYMYRFQLNQDGIVTSYIKYTVEA